MAVRDGASPGMRAERRAALDRLRAEVTSTQTEITAELARLTFAVRHDLNSDDRADAAAIDRLLTIEAGLLSLERHWWDYVVRFPLAHLEVGQQSRVEDFTRLAA